MTKRSEEVTCIQILGKTISGRGNSLKFLRLVFGSHVQQALRGQTDQEGVSKEWWDIRSQRKLDGQNMWNLIGPCEYIKYWGVLMRGMISFFFFNFNEIVLTFV